ncbi:LAMI_0F10968g1_1 [Lachancea mirantina]|uniref:LAMI_0F10968g1_1 n=1 Tax=Lachancea mirantina TaxID=1230905 RepID=A0A1G4K2F7_9SACH|nr:LAMI_0F10968g1_1 [Lachancea mirantina]
MSHTDVGASAAGSSRETGVDDVPETAIGTLATQTNRARDAKESVLRRLHFLGRKFNILDRLPRRNSGDSPLSLLQYGANADGVFSNLTAKPDTRDGAGTVPESDKPPTYDEAAADIVPSYYGMDEDGAGMYYNEICFEGLPVGNVVNLLWNIIVSVSFQFVGFLLTYILHTSHAAKQGSRLGLGLTFLGYAYSMIPSDVTSKVGRTKQVDRIEPVNPNDINDARVYAGEASRDEFESQLSHGVVDQKQNMPFLVVLLLISGILIVCKAIYDYVKVKKMERRYLTQERV